MLFQFSNGSGMFTLADQNYNLAKELPPGWELRFLSTGQLRVPSFIQYLDKLYAIKVDQIPSLIRLSCKQA